MEGQADQAALAARRDVGGDVEEGPLHGPAVDDHDLAGLHDHEEAAVAGAGDSNWTAQSAHDPGQRDLHGRKRGGGGARGRRGARRCGGGTARAGRAGAFTRRARERRGFGGSDGCQAAARRRRCRLRASARSGGKQRKRADKSGEGSTAQGAIGKTHCFDLPVGRNFPWIIRPTAPIRRRRLPEFPFRARSREYTPPVLTVSKRPQPTI